MKRRNSPALSPRAAPSPPLPWRIPHVPDPSPRCSRTRPAHASLFRSSQTLPWRLWWLTPRPPAAARASPGRDPRRRPLGHPPPPASATQPHGAHHSDSLDSSLSSLAPA
eukprot:EG_transcript_22591